MDERQTETGETFPPGPARSPQEAIPTRTAPTGTDPLPDLSAVLAPAEAPGELGRLGHYRALAVLGAGGMGVVLEAEDLRLQRRVALKVMRPGLAAEPGARDRFLREARAAAAVEHDHVVTVFEVGEERGVPFLAMQLLRGETLAERIRREGKLPVAEVVRVGREAALGLAAAHGRGLVHRDVKPGNLWLEGEPGASATGGRVKVLDFGLARLAEGGVRLTQPGVVVGTLAYMAPEQARGQAVDFRSDLFSLGCVLYHLCTGRPPFQGVDPIASLMALATEQPPPPHEVCPEVPPALSALVMQMLARDPARRPASAQAVAEALQGPLPPGAPTTAPTRPAAPLSEQATQVYHAPAASPRLPRRKRRRAVAVLLALALAALAPLAYFLRDPGRTDTGKGEPTAAGEVPAPRPRPPPRPAPPPDPDPDLPPLGGVRAVFHVPEKSIPRLAPRPDDWPMEGWDGGNSYCNRSEKALAPPLVKAWERPLPGSLDGVVVSSGIVLVSAMGEDRKHKVFAVDARDGRHLWTFTLTGGGGGSMGVSPACAAGLAFFGGQGDDNLYAVHLWTGALRWKQAGVRGMFSNSPKVADQTLFALSNDSGLWAFEPRTGKQLWREHDARRQASIAVREGRLLRPGGAYGGALAGFDAHTGLQRWTTDGPTTSAVTAGDSLAFALYGGEAPVRVPFAEGRERYRYDRVAAFALGDGKKAWETPIGEDANHAALLLAGDALYVAVHGGRLHCLDARTGKVRKQRRIEVWGRLIATGNLVFVSTREGIAALAPDTLQTRWQTATRGSMAAANGRLFVAADGRLIAFANARAGSKPRR